MANDGGWQEAARNIPGFDGYSVTSDGQVFGPSAHVLTPIVDRDGYRRVRLSLGARNQKRSMGVHVAVLLAWVGPMPDGMEAAHIDGNPGNNVLTNLRWATHSSNVADKVAHGTDPKGGRNPNAVISEGDAEDIRAAYAAGGVTQRRLAARYGIAQSAVWSIVHGHHWAPARALAWPADKRVNG